MHRWSRLENLVHKNEGAIPRILSTPYIYTRMYMCVYIHNVDRVNI